MSISRVKPSNWAINQKLTSAQINQIDTSLTYALDKRDGYSDTLSSSIAVDGYFTFETGSSITMKSGSTITLQSGSILVSDATSTANLSGVTNHYGNCNIRNGALLQVLPGATQIFSSTSSLVAGSGVTVNLAGATTTVSDFTVNSTNKVKLTSRSVSRAINGWILPPTNDWVISAGLPSTGSTSVHTAMIPLHLPHGSVLTSISVYIQPDSGHANLPATMPQFLLLRKTFASTTNTLIAIGTDSSADATEYETVHPITASGFSETIDRTQYIYMIDFTSEGSTNAVDNMKLRGCLVTCTVTSMDDLPI